MPYRDLKVMEASERAADRVNGLLDGPSGRRLIHVVQIRNSVQSVSANIGEAFGRGEGRDRARVLRIARGEAEETIRHLDANFRMNGIVAKDYWPIRNLLVVVVRMLTSLTRYELYRCFAVAPRALRRWCPAPSVPCVPNVVETRAQRD
jgi:four helix bundle protein